MYLKVTESPQPAGGYPYYGLWLMRMWCAGGYPYSRRFMVDAYVVGCNWIELPITKYFNVKDSQKKSSCQVYVVTW